MQKKTMQKCMLQSNDMYHFHYLRDNLDPLYTFYLKKCLMFYGTVFLSAEDNEILLLSPELLILLYFAE